MDFGEVDWRFRWRGQDEFVDVEEVIAVNVSAMMLFKILAIIVTALKDVILLACFPD